MAKKKKVYTLLGQIVDRGNARGIAGVRVEAWDKDLVCDDLIGSAVTDAEGAFQIEFDESSCRELFADRRPDLFFKIFRGEELVKSTEDSVLWNMEAGEKEVVIEVELSGEQPREQSFEVKGTVQLADGSPVDGISVSVFDRNLRHEEELGKTQTNKQGFYQLRYTARQFLRAEKGSADLVAKAFAADGSLLAASAVLFNAPPSAELNVTIPAEVRRPPSLFEKISQALEPLLVGVPIEELEEDKEHHDVTFLAGETGFEKRDLARFFLAHKLTPQGIQAEFWFALLGGSLFQYKEDQNLKEQLAAFTGVLPTLDAAMVQKAIASGFARNDMAEVLRGRTEDWIAVFLKIAAGLTVRPGDAPTFTKQALENAGIKDAAKQEKFALLFNQYQAMTPELVAALRKDRSFSQAEVATLQVSYKIADVARGDFSIVKTIKEEFGVDKPEQIPKLAGKSKDEWVALVKRGQESGALAIPLGVIEPAAPAAANVPPALKAELYGSMLERQFREAFPTAAFTAGLGRSLSKAGARGLPQAAGLHDFLQEHEDFDLLSTPVDDFLKASVKPGMRKLAVDESFRTQIKATQRVFKLAPTFEATDTLLENGMHSAQKVYRMGKSEFVEQYGNAPGFTRESAVLAWERAAGTYAAALTIVGELQSLNAEGLPLALKSEVSTPPPAKGKAASARLAAVAATGAATASALSSFPNWSNLFQGGDLCECEHCRSVLSPAAYFADILTFLKDRKAKNPTDTVKDVLFRRRPDLGYLELNCENALVPLPYIDVVCEVLEAAVDINGDNDLKLVGLTAISSNPVTAKSNVATAFQQAFTHPTNNGKEKIGLGADFSLNQVDPVDPDRWVVHGQEATYLLKKKSGPTFFAEILPNTKASAAELRAYPQYVNPLAYKKLREAKYPLALPFDLFAEEVRAAFQKSNLRRWELMETFRGPTNPTDGEIAAEYFGISVDPSAPFDEKRLILVASATIAGQKAVWGEAAPNWLTVIGNVKTFLQKTGLEYNELLVLLDLKFINPAGNIAVQHLDASCDLDKKVLLNLNRVRLDRIHRFLRLWRKLKGWKMWEVDLVIRHPRVGNGSLNEAFLINLFYFSRLRDRLGGKTSVEQVCALFGNLNTKTRFTKLHEKREAALYQNLFLNKRLIHPLDPAFQLDSLTGDLPVGETITAHHPVLLAALGIREGDLVLFKDLHKWSDGLSYITDDLTLGNLSFLWRHAWLAKVLKFKAEEWKTVLKLFQQDLLEFATPQAAWKFVEQVDQLKAAGFTPDELNWLLAADRSAKAATKEADAARFLAGLRKDLRAIQAEYDPSSPQYDFLSPPRNVDHLSALLIALLQKLDRDEAEAEVFLKTLRGPVLLEADVQGLSASFAFPATITAGSNYIPISYDWVLRFSGLMTAAQKTILLSDPSLIGVIGLSSYQQAIQNLFDGSEQTTATALPAGFTFPPAITAVIPIRYESVFRFNGVMTDAQRTVLLDDTAPALAALYTTGQLEANVPGLLPAFTFPTQIPIQHDVLNQLFRFTGLMTDSQRGVLLNDPTLIAVAADPLYRGAIDELYQKSLAAVTNYQGAIEDLFQQSATVGDTFVSTKVILTGSVTLPIDRPSLPLRYNQATQELVFIGLMSGAERLALHAAGNPVSLIDELFWLPRLAVKFYEPVFTAPLEVLPPTVDFKAQLSADLAAKISYDPEEQLLRFAGIMSSAEQATLNALVLNTLPVEMAYHAAVNDLASQPQAMPLLGDRIWLTENELNVTLPANDTLAKRLAGAATKALGYLSRTLMANTVVEQCSAKLGLTEAVTRHLLNSYAVVMEPLLTHLIGIFAATSGAVDYSTLTTTFDGWFWATRAALLPKRWKATLVELKSIVALSSSGQFLHLASLPLDGTVTSPPMELFLRTGHLFKLRDSLPETKITLFEVLEKLGGYNTVAEFAADVERLNEAWLATEVEAFVGSTNLTYQPEYLLPETWEQLRRAFYFFESLNAGAVTVSSFAAAAMTNTHAKMLKELLRSKFGTEAWLTLSAEIQDLLRERKRDALAAYMLTQPPPNAPSQKWENTNDLYAYYLLDVEMSSCQLTSRLVQASGSVQLFVQRCLMGLEPDVAVQPDGATGDSAWRWWQWMRKYRVWEANRKVFLWPENWIAPELKKDRSSFFKDLENELLQNEVNQHNAETALTNYLEKLDGVAQLEIAGFYQEDDGDNTIVHVFGRTRGAEPHLYYYRRYDYHQWTPWEKVELDIQGDYLIPAVIANRLFLFWPVFTEVPDEEKNSTVAIPNTGDSSAPLQPTFKRKSMQVAVSDYRGKWSPKRVSKDVDLSAIYSGETTSKHYRFFAIDRSEIDGRFGIVYDGHSTSARRPEKGRDDYHHSSFSGNGNPLLAKMSGAFEIANCAGVPALADFPFNFYDAIHPEAESAGYQTDYLKWAELINRTDIQGPPDDFTLEVINGFSNGYALARLLERTPGPYQMSPSWHLSYFDKVLLDGSMLLSPLFGARTATPIGIGLPFLYNDKKRTFFTLPCLSIDHPQPAPAPPSDFSRAYYPETKRKLRATEEAFEGLIRTWLKDFVVPPAGSPTRLALEQALAFYFPTDPAPFSNGQIKELMVRLWMRSIHLYLGSGVLSLLRSSRYHFKNFYHWFVCDFLKLVANPRQGIPGLMRRETQLKNSGFSFRQTYQPTFLVVDPATEEFYPKEIVDFSPDGAYSSYNWELFFHAPLLIANALSRNQKFEEARDWYHFIFNPIGVESGIPGGSPMSKFWITKPFFEAMGSQYIQQRIDNIMGMLKGNADLESQVRDWRTNPFEPHRIANYRTVAYQKTVVMNYLDNLIAWGDFLFRQDSMESINEATQLYVLAAEILGPPPKKTPPQAKPPLLSFNELEFEFDAFSNALVQVENLVPQLPGGGSGSGNAPPLPMLYFCIPQNDKMLGYWDTVADRLYKIRHCMNIEGVVRQLALFEPEIDPGALVKAMAGGADITSALADLNAPLPFYRFSTLLQKANEVCGDVKALGGALLGALEKKDAEALSLLRQGQEIRVLEATKAVREKQIEEAKENLEGIKKSKIVTETRRNYYRDIERLSSQEKLHLDKLAESHKKQEIAQGIKTIAGVLSYLPDIDLGASGFGGTPLAKFKIGGLNLGQATSIAGDVVSFFAQMAANDAIMASVNAGNERRWAEWQLQLRLAERELDQFDRQLAAGKLRIAIAEKELANHLLQIDNARAMDAFMRSKYTNLELYQWQMGQISSVYFQSYKLAYDLAKRAERCFRFELGLQESSYISFGYWDSLKKGLLAGEKLQYDLRRLETAYLEQNRRAFELTKHVSIGQLDPIALIKLRETGRCFFQLPEEIFDLDYPGHYFRQLKSVSLTLPCVTGPYTTISCTLRLLKNSVRINTANGDDGYPRNATDGLPSDDERFIESSIPFKAIAASSAQNDSGVFELNFRDERYLPFEGAGAISEWSLELFTDLPSNNSDPSKPDFGKLLRQFDYDTISDAILHLKYTAREDAGVFKNGAVAHLRDYFSQLEATPSVRMFNLKRDFPTQWYRFLHPTDPTDGNVFELELSRNLFPLRDAEKTLKINTIQVLARCTNVGSTTPYHYKVVMQPPFPVPSPSSTPPDPNEMSLVPVNQYGGLYFSQKGDQQTPLELSVTLTDPPAQWRLKMVTSGDEALWADPITRTAEVEDVILVLGYQWDLS